MNWANSASDESERLLASAADLGPELINKLSAPFLLATPPNWLTARKRLLVVGQETFGWGGDADNDPKGRLKYWLELSPRDSVAQLAQRYQGMYEGYDQRSPFWRAHTDLVSSLGGDGAVMWSNLMRVDTGPLGKETASAWWNLSYSEVDRICEWQKNLHLAELEALRPNAVVFFTGPHYDYCLRKTFDELSFAAEEALEDRAFARLRSSRLPATSIRTYHPNYLSRSGQWTLVGEIGSRLAAI